MTITHEMMRQALVARSARRVINESTLDLISMCITILLFGLIACSMYLCPHRELHAGAPAVVTDGGVQ